MGTEGSASPHQYSNEQTGHKNGNGTRKNNSSSDEHQIKGASSGVQNREDSTSRYVPISPHIADLSGNSSRELVNENSLQSTPNDHSSQSLEASSSALDSSSSMHFNAHHTSNGFRGLKGHQNNQSESQEMLLQSTNNIISPSLAHSQLSSSRPSSSSTHDRISTSSRPSSIHLNSSHGHTSSSYASTDDASISRMSASTVEIRGSAESMQLAHLFKVHSLQEELEHLKSKLNDRSVPLEEIIQDASCIHLEHQQLTRDVEAFSTNLDALRNKDNGKVSEQIAKSKRAIENEVSIQNLKLFGKTNNDYLFLLPQDV